jgi:UDP-GlcNAc:undecaprenyl-phosphate GlcNAc-1-phosphate transferase
VNTYFAIFLIATFSALTITPLLRRLCVRLGLLDFPLGRKVHKQAVPRLGGVAIYASVVISLSTLPLVDNLLTQSLKPHIPQLIITLVPATLVLLLGVYDDLRGTNATVKFIGLGLIATLFYFMGGRIEVLAIPFVGTFHLPSTLAFVVTIFWLVGIANAFNLIDGLDGLASGAALFSTIVMLVVSLAQENPMMIVVTLVFCGALAGFLRYNFNPASIFLGDSGSLFIGFTLAALSVLGTQKATTAVAIITPILAFALPVVDTSVTMARRLISRKPLFQGDREHIHHMLLHRGWSQRHAAMVLYGVCGIFGLLAAISTKTSSPTMGFGLFVIAIAVIIAVGHLRYHEMDEIKAGVKRNFGDRRLRMANNVSIRRASEALSKASNLNELFGIVTQMLESGEFAYANVQIGLPGHSIINLKEFKPSGNGNQPQSIELRNGQISWAWQHNGIQPHEVIDSRRFWCFRVPLATDRYELGWINFYRSFESAPLLININYLTDLFRTEFSQAVERILEESKRGEVADELRTSAVAGGTTS